MRLFEEPMRVTNSADAVGKLVRWETVVLDRVGGSS